MPLLLERRSQSAGSRRLPSGIIAPIVAGSAIDYVLVQPGTEVLSAGIIRTARDGKYPSDHSPSSRVCA